MRVTDLEKFSLEQVWRPYQTWSPFPTDKTFQGSPANLDETAQFLQEQGRWSDAVLDRIRRIGVTFPPYIVHPLVDLIRESQALEDQGQ